MSILLHFTKTKLFLHSNVIDFEGFKTSMYFKYILLCGILNKFQIRSLISLEYFFSLSYTSSLNYSRKSLRSDLRFNLVGIYLLY